MTRQAIPGRSRRTAITQGANLRCLLLGVLLATGAAAGEAQPAIKQVLVLQSFDRGLLVLDYFTGNFRVLSLIHI